MSFSSLGYLGWGRGRLQGEGSGVVVVGGDLLPGGSLEVLFIGVFLGSSLLFVSCGVGGPILVDGTCQVTCNPYGFHGYRGGAFTHLRNLHMFLEILKLIVENQTKMHKKTVLIIWSQICGKMA